MTIALPPARTRFWFWAVGRRVDPLYRPWVAQQIVSGDYARRRLWSVIAVQMLLVVIPQTLLALAEHSRWRLITPAVLFTLYTVYVVAVIVRRGPMSDGVRQRLLAYHGVSAEGSLTTPVSAWSLRPANPVGKAGIVLLCAQLLVFCSGIAVAADWIVANRACHALRVADAAALQSVIGQPVPAQAAGLGAPAPVVAPGTALIAAREVQSGFPGMRYAAGYVAEPSGVLFGPGVWRVLDPGTVLNPGPAVNVDAQNFPARQITPNIGYGTSPRDPKFDQAQDCARSAR